MTRKLLAGNGLVVALGILVGVSSALGSWLPLAAIVGLAVLLASVRFPSMAVWLVFVGILMAEQGLMNARVFGLPITLSKLAVLLAFIVHTVQVGVVRRPLIVPMPVSGGAIAIVLSMVASLIASIAPSKGFEPIASVVMLVVMMHVLYAMTPKHEVPWLLRAMAAATLLIIVWTLFSQRTESFYVQLDHAWTERTTGGFGDPNLWGACMIVISPMMIAAMAHDDHWLGDVLLMGLLALFPLAILQTMSRSALLGFAIVSPAVLWTIRHKRTHLLLAAGAAAVALPVVVNVEAMLLRYQTLIDPTLESSLGHASLTERKALLDAGILIIKNHWLRGIGVGMFPMYAAYVTSGEVWKIAHNTYINVFAEQGLPGVFSHGLFVLQTGRAAVALWLGHHDARVRAIGLGFVAGLVGLAVIAFTLNLVNFAMFWYTLAIGLVIGRYAEQAAPDAPDRAPPRQVAMQEAVA